MMNRAEHYSVHGEDWDGIFYPSNNEKEKAVIVFSGSDGGLQHAGKHACFLADNGIPALAFALFKTKHTGNSLDMVPIERIKKGIDYLKEKGFKKIAVDGTSKGAEYAFACALAYKELSFVIVKTPSWFYSEGLKGKEPTGNSCWSKNGKSLPFTPYKTRKINAWKSILKNKEYNILEINTGKKINPKSIIPLENLQVPILMFSTKVDTIWPSYESCEKIIERLKKNNYKYPYKHIAFEHMSHMMIEYCGKEIKYFVKSEKENPKACYKERDIMGQETIKWLKEIW